VPERRIPIVNILGMTEEMTSPGAIVFEREGRSWRLDAILEAPGDRELFVMFSDATSGKQTYGAGRFLYVGLPNADRIEVDFNEAFNPPCAFTDFATCPLPPQQNRLALAIDAGELKYERGTAPFSGSSMTLSLASSSRIRGSQCGSRKCSIRVSTTASCSIR
jgi:uncharacterized protein (DUF1684 family)